MKDRKWSKLLCRRSQSPGGRSRFILHLMPLPVHRTPALYCPLLLHMFLRQEKNAGVFFLEYFPWTSYNDFGEKRPFWEYFCHILQMWKTPHSPRAECPAVWSEKRKAAFVCLSCMCLHVIWHFYAMCVRVCVCVLEDVRSAVQEDELDVCGCEQGFLFLKEVEVWSILVNVSAVTSCFHGNWCVPPPAHFMGDWLRHPWLSGFIQLLLTLTQGLFLVTE